MWKSHLDMEKIKTGCSLYTISQEYIKQLSFYFTLRGLLLYLKIVYKTFYRLNSFNKLKMGFIVSGTPCRLTSVGNNAGKYWISTNYTRYHIYIKTVYKVNKKAKIRNRYNPKSSYDSQRRDYSCEYPLDWYTQTKRKWLCSDKKKFHICCIGFV